MMTSKDDSTIWVYGYHGTSRSIAEIISAEGFQIRWNGYDWLGTGVYFWQDAPNHALHWARRKEDPVVIKSRLRLDSTCLDLLDMADIDNPDFWMDSYNGFIQMCQRTGTSIPEQDLPNIIGKRHLDCAFFDYIRTAFEQDSNSKSIGAIRSAFVEGKAIFPGSAICDKTHIQISIFNLDLIEDSYIM